MMGQEIRYKELFPTVAFRYVWKILELVFIIVFSNIFDITGFGISFFCISFVSLLFDLVKTEFKSGEPEVVKTFYRSYLASSAIFGLAFASIIFIASVFIEGQVSSALKFVSMITFLSSFTLVPESFYSSRERHDKIYKSNAFSQLTMGLFVLLLSFRGFGWQSILYGYLIYTISRILFLWKDFPFNVRPSFDSNAYSQLISLLKKFFAGSFTETFLHHGLLWSSIYFFGFNGYSILFVYYSIGFFMFQNITLFIPPLLLSNFKEYLKNKDLFKFNLVRLMEYLSFAIVPFMVISLILAKEIAENLMPSSFWNYYDTLAILVIAGLLKSLSGVMRIVFLVKDKPGMIARLNMIEIGILAILVPILTYALDMFGFALSILISSAAVSYLYLFLSLRSIRTTMLAISRDYFYILFAGSLTGLSLGLIKELFVIDSIFQVILFFAIGKIIYFFLTFASNKDLYKRFIRFVYLLAD